MYWSTSDGLVGLDEIAFGWEGKEREVIKVGLRLPSSFGVWVGYAYSS